jgi:hypothetical protein
MNSANFAVTEFSEVRCLQATPEATPKQPILGLPLVPGACYVRNTTT